ncbi:hypothetical protein [Lacipirellula limnantheis]|uniref:hypothetical protein n=1 Tax=Lacipirellula limnantheis TaxID=2528024 RepID=UPI0011A698CF|nr:hypothetical protein [Lacipirellula limnantheis]
MMVEKAASISTFEGKVRLRWYVKLQTPEARIMLRCLRLTAAFTCIMLCSVFIVFWMRSYKVQDGVTVWYATGKTVAFGRNEQRPLISRVIVGSTNGTAAVRWAAEHVFSGTPERVRVEFLRDGGYDSQWAFKKRSGFAFSENNERAVQVAAPYWFVTLVTGTAGTLLWMNRPYRFTLRGSLAVTTLIALVLGASVVFSR